MLEWTEIIPGFDESNEEEIIGFIERQRWFGSKGHSITGIGLAECLVISSRPEVVLALVEVRLGAEMPELYQMLLGVEAVANPTPARPIVTSTTEGGSDRSERRSEFCSTRCERGRVEPRRQLGRGHVFEREQSLDWHQLDPATGR